MVRNADSLPLIRFELTYDTPCIEKNDYEEAVIRVTYLLERAMGEGCTYNEILGLSHDPVGFTQL